MTIALLSALYICLYILGAFTKLQKAAVSFVVSVSVCPHSKPKLPLDRFGWFDVRVFFENLLREIKFH